MARAGDTFFFRCGLYNGKLRLLYSGTEDAWIRFLTYPGEQPEIWREADYYNRTVLIGPPQGSPGEYGCVIELSEFYDPRY
jgi:hypothetical protein